MRDAGGFFDFLLVDDHGVHGDVGPQNQEKLRDWIEAKRPDAVLSTFVTVWDWLRDEPDRPGPPLAGIDQNWEQIGTG